MTKNISLSNEAYEILKNIKRKDESFSDVIIKLIGTKGNLSEILNLYPELKEEQKFEDNVEKNRKESDKRLKMIEDEMS